MVKQISVTIDEELLKYLDDLADINGRSRSGMINWLIQKSYDEDKALDEEAKYVLKLDNENVQRIAELYSKCGSTEILY